ncbi:MAG: triose-phosphate isomerase [Rhodospirillales bacterium]|nr:triose-phosphate isomerase [Rhodospirillales bacterium]
MNPIRRPLIAGNWKMNGQSADVGPLAGELAARLNNAGNTAFDMLVCPPFTLLAEVIDVAGDSGLMVGAQDCHAAEKGAHTGDISAAMLADLGCSHVILGHSERRTNHGETSTEVCIKTRAAWAAGLVAVVCVGETESERDDGKTLEIVGSQISESLPDGATSANTVIAYEPVWAIGTGRTASPDEAQAVHAFIRAELNGRFGGESARMCILYGGSMKPDNAAELIALSDIDGGLIGGASLIADDFWAIGQSCS